MWWDGKGIVHHELLPVGPTIDSQRYCGQLDRLRFVLWQLHNKKGVVFRHKNARPHTLLMTRQKLRELYSSDLAPSDYHLFRLLQNSFNRIQLVSQ